jgi:hypothetical protein
VAEAVNRVTEKCSDVAAVTDYLEPVVTEADPNAKVLPRFLIEELRVICRAEILPTSRLVRHVVCAMSVMGGTKYCANQVLAAAALSLD